jgi:cell division protein FtsI/penicillin-binding protein 2
MIKKIQTTLFNNFKNYLDFLVKYLNTTNRIKIVFLLFIFYALIIIITSFKYSILEYDYYKTLANKQQTTSIINNANR